MYVKYEPEFSIGDKVKFKKISLEWDEQKISYRRTEEFETVGRIVQICINASTYPVDEDTEHYYEYRVEFEHPFTGKKTRWYLQERELSFYVLE